MRKMNLEVVEWGVPAGILANLSIQPTIFDEIRENQAGDVKLDGIREKIKQGKATDFKIHEDGSLRYKGRWCVPQKCEEVKRKLMEEGHNTLYSVHPGGDKLYKDLKKIDSRFLSSFWKSVQENFGTTFKMSTAFHPATDGQTERTIQTLEDMLRACVKDFQGGWEDSLDLIEFSYNNSYHASIGMAPFEALYGKKCRSPNCWNDICETMILGPQMIEDTVKQVKGHSS
ncbi:uncharacterized protein LOC110717016 [Chenopodium quinoa]|uniref:uncharacterized protein LOC110717016 n=1 Tax=Chenopodium quinoa TaxID=63459 RepID=UPI000B788297|nr:uncharacterized protein LOC110717016 [Chenopodium quinoa]